MILWTTRVLYDARKLYRKAGFNGSKRNRCRALGKTSSARLGLGICSGVGSTLVVEGHRFSSPSIWTLMKCPPAVYSGTTMNQAQWHRFQAKARDVPDLLIGILYCQA